LQPGIDVAPCLTQPAANLIQRSSFRFSGFPLDFILQLMRGRNDADRGSLREISL
jgi:hypothetical protein